ncbi:hypothetical protein JT321_gp60 [Providencia phage Kokobel1]|uniref:Uncharacterized protein n=1 Tax=Providencia phage Kokobel1 TaxID=2783540 RepID=A0A873WWK7_9CAUD|nr:hypothetical protein JT321_gp60 [Providencia phage Kokobel1]QPB11487.1 hypothetical protein [Providencia phage Kokobel1]
MAELKFTKKSIFESIASDAASLPAKTSIDTRGDFESQLSNLFDEHDLTNAPECVSVDYFAEAWETVQSNEFDDVEIDEPLDFSGCESSLQCLMLEANAMIRAAWAEQSRAYVEELAAALAEVVEGCEEFGSIDELIITKGCRLGDIPHAREFDAGDYSVCMWKEDAEGDAEIYYNFKGLEFRGTVYGVNQ